MKRLFIISLAGIACSTLLFSAVPKAQEQQKSKTFIVGGGKTSIKKWTFLVALVYGDYKKPHKGYLCGGSLIRPRLVLTAAHCLKHERASNIRVIAKQTDLRKKTGRLVQATGIRIHPDFREGPLRPDLALLRLQKPIKTKRAVLTPQVPESGWMSVAGWGWNGGRYSPFLKAVTVPKLSDTICQNIYGGSFQPAFNFCAGGEGEDTCVGDSGSPVIQREGGRAKIYGIVSFGGLGCRYDPTVYAKLDLPWIKRAVKQMLRG